MFSSARLAARILPLGMSLVALGTASAAGASQITVSVREGIVGSSVRVHGRGFRAGARIQVLECGRTFWIDPNVPCNTANAITVAVGGRGSFSSSFRLEVCPEGEPIGFPTRRRCYIGAFQMGEDTGTLAPFATVAVTYP